MTTKTFAKFLSKLERTTSRNKITEILADLFGKSDPEEIDKICYLLLGKLAAPFEGIEFNIAEKMMIRIISQAFLVSEKSVHDEFKKNGDLGTTAVKFREKSENLKTEKQLVGFLTSFMRSVGKEGRVVLRENQNCWQI
jgi:DNA ligase-1